MGGSRFGMKGWVGNRSREAQTDLREGGDPLVRLVVAVAMD